MEQRIRSLVKAISWRVLASTTTGFIAYIFTYDHIISSSIALIDFCVKTVLYYLHERLWNRIRWGRKYFNN